MAIAITLKQYLEDHHVAYDECPHIHTSTAIESARVAHISGDNVAKAVLLAGEEDYVLAALPANRRLALERISELLDEKYTLADERELGFLFGDCEEGAVPPVGEAYGLNVVWDDSLADMKDIYFEAGDHATLIHMAGDDFAKMMRSELHADISRRM